jgi:hypothetical protein
MRMRATNISGRESARLSVSSSRQVDEKRPSRGCAKVEALERQKVRFSHQNTWKRRSAQRKIVPADSGAMLVEDHTSIPDLACIAELWASSSASPPRDTAAGHSGQ